MMTFKIALRNIFRRKANSIITLSAIVFGCVALIFVGGFFQDVFIRIRDAAIGSHTGHFQVFKKGFNDKGRLEPYNYLIEDFTEIKKLIMEIPEVRSASYRLQFSGLISTGENTISFMGQGVQPEFEKVASVEEVRTTDLRYLRLGIPMMDSGYGLEPTDVNAVVIGRGLAPTMDVKSGETVTILVNTFNGSTNAVDVKVKGVFQTSDKTFDDFFLRIPLHTAQKLLDTKAIQSIVIMLHHTKDTETVNQILQQRFKEKNLDLEFKRWEELSDTYGKTVKLFGQFYLILQIVIAIVVVLGVFNTMNMAVMERISEIGTIMALGTRRNGVLKLFLYEGLILGVIGGTIGVIVGMIFVLVIGAIGIKMPPPPGGTFYWISEPLIVPSVVATTFCLSILIGGISAWFPACRASHMNITEALRYR